MYYTDAPLFLNILLSTVGIHAKLCSSQINRFEYFREITMPKNNDHFLTRAKQLIEGKKCFELKTKEDAVKIFCKLCLKGFKIDAIHLKTQFESHLKSEKHKKSTEKNILQPSISGAISSAKENISRTDSYSTKLVTAFIEAGIPIYKLRHPSIKKFFLDEHKEALPCVNTFYSKIECIHRVTLEQIRNEIGDNPIFFIVDETTDKLKRYVLNILVGKIDGTFSKARLLCSIFLEKTNNTTVQQGVIKACGLLYGSEIPFEKVWFLISDQARYMLLAGKGLKSTFPNIRHITCLIHALNRVCEFIKGENDLVNKLIAAMKAALSKSHTRRQLYSEICGIPFPPDVIEIRWNTWLEAAFYYATHFSKIELFIHALENDSKAVENLKKCMEESEELQEKLFDIHKYKFLTQAIIRLQKTGLTVPEQLLILSSVENKLRGAVLLKLKSSLSKNPDVDFFEKLPVDQKIICNYVPMTSADVERSFSIYRYILSERRHRLTESNLSMLNVIQFNNFISDEKEDDIEEVN